MTHEFKTLNWDENMLRLFLVNRGRSDILVAAHELLDGMKTRKHDAVSDAVIHNRYEVAVAIIFSLWRAVFLADGAGDWEAVLANAETFLEKLVRDNAINYADDWNNRAWSFVYYLGNANHRLRELADSWPEFKRQLTAGQLESLRGPIVGASALRVWRDHCTMLQEAIWLLVSPNNSGGIL